MLNSMSHEEDKKENYTIDNFRFIKKYPDNIKINNLKTTKENEILSSLELKDINVTFNENQTLLFYKEDNKVFIFDENFNKIQILISPKNDNTINFGYNIFFIEDYLCITGFQNDKLIIYV